ncbi:hypothetical protein FQA39_LY07111 [Lamprigera yunnana]|nr:hypothetical protein FQA39_LY07111 [Lamprigera yunnana]
MNDEESRKTKYETNSEECTTDERWKKKRTDIGEDDERQNQIKNKAMEEEAVQINKMNENKLDKIMSIYIQKTEEVVTLKKANRAKQGKKLRTSPYEHKTGAT